MPGRTVREPTPPGTRPLPRATPSEAVSTVERLLCELRPDRAGPFGWGPSAEAPAADERALGALALRLRVQTSPEVPAILPSAFASAARPTRGTQIAVALLRREDLLRRLHEVAQGDDVTRLSAQVRAVRALGWLQRHGTLARGAAALHTALAFALARPSQVERWRSGGTGASRGAVAWGADRVAEAVAEWAVVREVEGL